jgi:hypothetical protein
LIRRICSQIALVALCLVVVASAQTGQTTGTEVSVAQLLFQTPHRDKADEYEEGTKRHIAWLKAHQEKWSWHTWQVLTGKDTGSYIVGTFSHRWEDFDARENFSMAVDSDFKKQVGPFLNSSSCTFYVLRTDLSNSPEPNPEPKYLQLNIFAVRPEGAREFSQSIRKMNAALKQTGFKSESFLSPNSAGGHSRWYFMTNGGEGPQYMLVTDRNSYTDFNPVEKSLDDVMEQIYGKEQGDAIMSNVRKTFTHVYSELVQYRPDLSYTP